MSSRRLGSFPFDFGEGLVATVCAVSSRGSRLRLSVSPEDPGALLLSLPAGVPPAAAREFLLASSAWARSALAARERAPLRIRSGSEWEAQALLGSASFPLFGAERALRLAPAPGGSASLRFGDGWAELSCPDPERPALAARSACSDLTLSLGRRVLALLEPALPELALERLRVDSLRGKWGQRSSSREIALDWRCCFLPPDLFAHICAHEAAHILHMDHSPAFRRLLASLRPRAAEEARALRRWGTLIPR